MKKSLGIASILALSLLGLSTPRPVSAQSSVSASYRFVLEDDDQSKSLELDVVADEKGNADGRMTFTDAAAIPDVDDPDDPGADEPPTEFYATVIPESLIVEKNQAVIRGYVKDSSHRTYIGKWVQLVVEDNGTSRENADRLVWAFCNPQPPGWVPSDAERKDDDGAYWRWWATDAERKDDVGIPSKDLLPGDDPGCPAYPFSVHAFANVLKWEGDIIVKP
ncbi:MAG TPA: hypothetical protein VGX68_07685 [Thermoanaerobaculia bacterium]|jgi:hypothetical protein|nr:hypothetical protein [Thermoanaerobaculia bacterium]